MGRVDSASVRGGSSRFLWAAFVLGFLCSTLFPHEACSHAIPHALATMMVWPALIAYETCSQLLCIFGILSRKNYQKDNYLQAIRHSGRLGQCVACNISLSIEQ